MWPLSRSPIAAGRSRFTCEPSPSVPRLVRATVSGERSHQNPSGSTFTAVRQTPFTAILEPSLVSASTALHCTFGRRPPALITPTSSTIPVNTSLLHVSFHGELVGRNGVQPHAVELDGIAPMQAPGPTGDGKRPQSAQNLRRVVKENLVGDTSFKHGPVQLTAGFDHQRSILFSGQILNQLPKIRASPGPVEHEHSHTTIF